ncbi:hypothetical protein CR513_02251, partial [Mucuna pruriens]
MSTLQSLEESDTLLYVRRLDSSLAKQFNISQTLRLCYTCSPQKKPANQERATGKYKQSSSTLQPCYTCSLAKKQSITNMTKDGKGSMQLCEAATRPEKMYLPPLSSLNNSTLLQDGGEPFGKKNLDKVEDKYRVRKEILREKGTTEVEIRDLDRRRQSIDLRMSSPIRMTLSGGSFSHFHFVVHCSVYFPLDEDSSKEIYPLIFLWTRAHPNRPKEFVFFLFLHSFLFSTFSSLDEDSFKGIHPLMHKLSTQLPYFPHTIIYLLDAKPWMALLSIPITIYHFYWTQNRGRIDNSGFAPFTHSTYTFAHTSEVLYPDLKIIKIQDLCEHFFKIGSELKRTLKLKVRQSNVKSLRNLGSRMKGVQQKAFTGKYGRILGLLEIDVKVGALTTLAQFYDPPVRCFTFKDFQLTPTLKEFDQILGCLFEKGRPYKYVGHYPSLLTISTSLKIDVRELASKKETKGGVDGFIKSYLEERARCLAEEGKWVDFMDILSLIIYGVVLFPNVEDFLDLVEIDIFLAHKHRKENMIPTFLANIYNTLTICHEKKGGTIICCLPLLHT